MAEIEGLYWPDDAGWLHCKGHVTREEFAAALVPLGESLPKDAVIHHKWARNLQTAYSRAEGLESEVRLYDKPGRGSYPVTVFYRGAYLDQKLKERRQSNG